MIIIYLFSSIVNSMASQINKLSIVQMAWSGHCESYRFFGGGWDSKKPLKLRRESVIPNVCINEIIILVFLCILYEYPLLRD